MSKKQIKTKDAKVAIKRKIFFKKYGKNTTKGLRIKQSMLEKRAQKSKLQSLKIKVIKINIKSLNIIFIMENFMKNFFIYKWICRRLFIKRQSFF